MASTAHLSPTTAELFTTARLLAVEKLPYMAAALFQLRPVEADIATLAVDAHWRVYLGRAFIAAMADADSDNPTPDNPYEIAPGEGVTTLAFGLLHEVGHVLRSHNERGKEHAVKNHDLWNSVGDAAINHSLDACGVPCPKWVVTYNTIGAVRGPLEEAIYDALLPMGDPHPQPCDGDEDSGEGSGSGQGPDSNQPADNGDSGASGGSGHDDEPGCGSGAGGPARAYELPADDNKAPGVSGVTADVTRRKVAEDIRTAAHNAPGTVGGDLNDWAEHTLAPAKVSWRQLLRGAVGGPLTRRAGQSDVRMDRPGRRNQDPRTFTGRRVARSQRVAVVVDQSGSMPDLAVSQAFSEVLGIVAQAGIPADSIDVYSVDADVAEAVTAATVIERANQGGFVRAGCGGTDMRVGINAALNAPGDLDAVVVLTDAMTDWPNSAAELGRTDLIAIVIGETVEQAEHLLEEYVPHWITSAAIAIK